MSTREEFLARYGELFEHSPWIVEQAWLSGPFATADELHAALMDVVARASPEQRLALVRAHPELADRVAQAKGLTAASAAEQAAAGLTALSAEEFEKFHQLNRRYRELFGFPFIICVGRHSKTEILAAMQQRLGHTRDQELDEAITQIGAIVALRLASR